MTPTSLAADIATVATSEPWITSIGVDLRGSTSAEAATLITEIVAAFQAAGVDIKGIRVDAAFANVGQPVAIAGGAVNNALNLNGVTILADLDLIDRMEIMLRR